MTKKLKFGLFLVLSLSLVSAVEARGGYGRQQGRGSNGSGYQSTRGNTCCESTCCKTTCCSDGMVSVTRSTPAELTLGQEFTVTLTAKARCNCTGVVIKEMMPSGLVYLSSTPAAAQNGCELVWDLGCLCEGECKRICITYRANEEGCLSSCYSVIAEPICCQCIRVGCPELKVTKCGPKCVRICSPVRHHIKVWNCGCMCAKDVWVVDQVPEELQHPSCQKCIKRHIGDLAPGQCYEFDLCFTAVKCGTACNTVIAEACGNCGCPPASACWQTEITECKLCVEKTGPEGPLTVGDTARYKIVTKNPGCSPIHDVKIVDTAPACTTIIGASDGGQIHTGRVLWHLDVLGAGESHETWVELCNCCPGCTTNQVNVSATGCDGCYGCTACDNATTRWLGVPALNSDLCSSCNACCVCGGNDVTFCITVQNRGQADDKNVKVVVEFPDELQPIAGSAGGATKGTVDGSTVTFDAIPSFQANRCVRYHVKAKPVEKGDARVKAKISSDALGDPLIQTEAINLY